MRVAIRDALHDGERVRSQREYWWEGLPHPDELGQCHHGQGKQTVPRRLQTGLVRAENGTRGRVSRVPFPGLLVEARGIEPRSEHDSDTAPTCVDKAF